MSYGIEIINSSDRIVIDLNYANFGLFSNNLSTATPGSSYPGLAGTVASDLIVARANYDINNANGVVSKTTIGTWAQAAGGAATTVSYYVLRRFDVLNPALASGYGIAVYNTSSNVIFSSNIAKNFEIVTVGTFNSQLSNVSNLFFPSNTTWYSDIDKYYCVTNPSSSLAVAFFLGGWIVTTRGYRYQFANATHGRIIIESNIRQGTTQPTKVNADFHYMILKELS
jgi:hypothetical protein